MRSVRPGFVPRAADRDGMSREEGLCKGGCQHGDDPGRQGDGWRRRRQRAAVSVANKGVGGSGQKAPRTVDTYYSGFIMAVVKVGHGCFGLVCVDRDRRQLWASWLSAGV